MALVVVRVLEMAECLAVMEVEVVVLAGDTQRLVQEAGTVVTLADSGGRHGGGGCGDGGGDGLGLGAPVEAKAGAMAVVQTVVETAGVVMEQ